MDYPISKVPDAVRKWLGSANTSDYLDTLAKQFNFSIGSRGYLSDILYRLEVKELQPSAVIHELSDKLGISPSSAAALASDIEEKVLEPVKKNLLEWGVDITLVKKGLNVDSETGKIDQRLEKAAAGSLVKPAMPIPKIVPTAPVMVMPVMPRKIEPQMGGPKVRIIEKDTAPATVRESAVTPRVIETPVPSQNQITIRVSEKNTPSGSAPMPTKTVEITGGARVPKSTVNLPPQQIKVDPQYLSTLKTEGDKVMLKEEAPVIIHKEGQMKPIDEPATTFRSNVEANYVTPAAPKTVAARVEIGGIAEAPKPPGVPARVVNFTQSPTPGTGTAIKPTEQKPIGGILPTQPSQPVGPRIAPPAPTAPQRTAIKIEAPAKPPFDPKSEAKISGNVVDLS